MIAYLKEKQRFLCTFWHYLYLFDCVWLSGIRRFLKSENKLITVVSATCFMPHQDQRKKKFSFV